MLDLRMKVSNIMSSTMISVSQTINSVRTGDSGDLFQFDTVTLEWIDLTDYTQGVAPFPRDSHGVAYFAGSLYVFGGFYAPGDKPFFTARKPNFL